MKITAGHPPDGAGAAGSVRVAASGVPSADEIVTFCVLNARAGAAAPSAAATASTTRSPRLADIVTVAKGSRRM